MKLTRIWLLLGITLHGDSLPSVEVYELKNGFGLEDEAITHARRYAEDIKGSFEIPTDRSRGKYIDRDKNGEVVKWYEIKDWYGD